MQKLSVQLTPEDKQQVETYLEMLFMLQDKPLGHDKKAALLSEIYATRYPCYAILKGLSDLSKQSVDRISFPEIEKSIIDSMQSVSSVSGDKCQYCGWLEGTNKGGTVSMIRNSTLGDYAFACICKRGQDVAMSNVFKKPLLVWNGKTEQYIKSEKFTHRYWHLFKTLEMGD